MKTIFFSSKDKAIIMTALKAIIYMRDTKLSKQAKKTGHKLFKLFYDKKKKKYLKSLGMDL